MIRKNKIKDCPVMIQYINVAMKIWGKNIAALKGKTTQSKMHPVARDCVKFPNKLLKLHKEIFLTTDIFFVNKIYFCLTLSCNIFSTALNHLADRDFKEMRQNYLQRGFHITTVHVDSESTRIKTLIESIPGGPMVNLVSTNKHVPEIECQIRVVK
jgi:hypothetical protein